MLKRPTSILGWVAWLIGGSFVALCGCLALGFAIGGSSLQQQAAQQTALAGVTPERPTEADRATERPTATSRPTLERPTAQAGTLIQTNTPGPTPTVRPSSTPRPTEESAPTEEGLTAEDRAAIVEMGTHVTALGEALGKIGELSQSYNPTNDEWKFAMVAQIVTIQQAHKDIEALEVPPAVERFKALTLEATTDCDAAMDKLISGLDQSSVSDLEEAGALMGSCGEKIAPAMEELNRLKGL